jgi:hypothetical protein
MAGRSIIDSLKEKSLEKSHYRWKTGEDPGVFY